jgi:hypothetical protein
MGNTMNSRDFTDLPRKYPMTLIYMAGAVIAVALVRIAEAIW